MLFRFKSIEDYEREELKEIEKNIVRQELIFEEKVGICEKTANFIMIHSTTTYFLFFSKSIRIERENRYI